jgi:hypothetical protein
MRQRVLDREIAAGRRPDSDAARGLRAQQLTSMPERRRLAVCLANILEAADARHSQLGGRLAAIHAPVLAARHDMVLLIDILRSERAVPLGESRSLGNSSSPAEVRWCVRKRGSE